MLNNTMPMPKLMIDLGASPSTGGSTDIINNGVVNSAVNSASKKDKNSLATPVPASTAMSIGVREPTTLKHVISKAAK